MNATAPEKNKFRLVIKSTPSGTFVSGTENRDLKLQTFAEGVEELLVTKSYGPEHGVTFGFPQEGEGGFDDVRRLEISEIKPDGTIILRVTKVRGES